MSSSVKTEVLNLAYQLELLAVSKDGWGEFYMCPVTRTMYLRHCNSLAAMLDPETGMPLTETRFRALFCTKERIT